MRVAILYASKYGFTKDIAMKIRNALGDHATVYNLNEETPMLEDYEGFVIGTAVYMGRTRKEVKEFLSRHTDELLTKKVWLFISGASKEDIDKQMGPCFPEKLIDHSIFKTNVGYYFNKEKMNLFDKLVMRIVDKDGTVQLGGIDEIALESLIHSIKAEYETEE